MGAKKDDRLELRIPGDLKRWVKKYAKQKNTDVSHLVVSFLTDLREQVKRRDANASEAVAVNDPSHW